MTLTQWGLLIDLVGVLLLFLDAYRVSSRFSEEGVTLGYGKKYSGFWWRKFGFLGLILLLTGFALQFAGTL